MSLKLWKYDLLETREDVLREMPDGWRVEVYKVTSGDSGKEYFVQKVARPGVPRMYFYLCNCREGLFRIPVAITGGRCCKHTENLIEFLKGKGKL